MTLTPLDIHNKEFKVVLRGYSEAEVDDFLDLVVKEFEALIRENGELKDRLDALEQALERYRTIEDSLNKTLLLAQQAAEEVRQAGEKEAQLLRERAMMEAQRIVDEARAKARQAVEDYAEIRREAELFRMRVKTLLQAQLEIFEEAALKEADRPDSPFAVGQRAAGLFSRYSGGEEAGDVEAVGGAGEETSREAAAVDHRGPGMERSDSGPDRPWTRPSLWGEPVGRGASGSGTARGGESEQPAGDEDDPDEDEEGERC